MLAIPALLGEHVTGPYEGHPKPPLEVVVVTYRTVLTFGSDGCSDCSCLDLKHHYCLDHLPSPPLKLPAVFAL